MLRQRKNSWDIAPTEHNYMTFLDFYCPLFLWLCLVVLDYETHGLCVHSVGSNATARGLILRLRYAGRAPDRRRRWRQQSRPMRRDAATHGRCRLDDDRCQSAAERWS